MTDAGPSKQLRTRQPTIRFSPAEWERVKASAARAGLKPSSYVRAAALRHTPKRPKSPRTGRTRFAERRTIRRTIRFHPTEWERVDRLARTIDLPPDRFVREVVVGYQLGGKVNAQAIRQLARIGNNINQISRVANTTGRVSGAWRLEEVLASLQKALDHLL